MTAGAFKPQKEHHYKGQQWQPPFGNGTYDKREPRPQSTCKSLPDLFGSWSLICFYR